VDVGKVLMFSIIVLIEFIPRRCGMCESLKGYSASCQCLIGMPDVHRQPLG